jgi:hypothetical protein
MVEKEFEDFLNGRDTVIELISSIDWVEEWEYEY